MINNERVETVLNFANTIASVDSAVLRNEMLSGMVFYMQGKAAGIAEERERWNKKSNKTKEIHKENTYEQMSFEHLTGG